MLNLIDLIISTSALFGSSALDFFNKTVGKPPVVFKMWMIIVLVVAVLLLVVLSAILIAVSVKEKQNRENEKFNSIDDDDSQTENENVINENQNENASVSNSEENTENISEETTNDDAQAENENANEAVSDETTDSDTNDIASDEVQENEVENANENVADDVTVEETNDVVADEVQENEPETQNDNNSESASDVVLINTDDTDKEMYDTMEKQKDESNAKVVFGKLNYYLTESGWYFSLDANNGQQLFVSYSFTTQDGAMKGFETFARAVQEGNFIVSEDKNGRFRYILNKKYQGPNYKTKAQCENAIASVKKFSQNYKVSVIDPTPEDQAAFAAYLENLKKAKDIEMDVIAKEEANTPKSGAFEIEEVDGGYRFYLYANNRQILYTSNIYASPVSAKNGIDAFKKAVYGGVVVIEKDKFANYRYILRNSTTVTYAGESYDTEASAKKSFESVKRFVKSAVIVPFKKKDEGEDAE